MSSVSAEFDPRLITAALDCFLAFGVRKTSLTDVADRAGVSRATAYRVFGDKNGLVRAVAEAEVGTFLDRLDQAVQWDAPLSDALPTAITFTLDYLHDHAVLQRLIAREPEQLTDLVMPRPGEHSLVQVLLPAVVERFVRTHHEVLRVPVDQAAEWLVRMAISLLLNPNTTLAEPGAVADLLIAGLVDHDSNHHSAHGGNGGDHRTDNRSDNRADDHGAAEDTDTREPSSD